MDVLQCPECELRFRFESELDDHLANEHPNFHVAPKSVEDSMLIEGHRHPRAERNPTEDLGPPAP